MASFNRQKCQIAILFLLVVYANGSPGNSLRYLARQRERFRDEANQTSTITTTVNPMEAQEDRDGTFPVENLFTPFPPSVALLAQLMSLSNPILDIALRGTLNNQSPVAQYAQSFRATLLQITQQLNSAYIVSSTNANQVKMLNLLALSKVKEATGYLEKLENSRMVEFLYLPLKNLKETTDQTFNLSSQIASQFGELFQLVDEVIKSHNSFKSIKEQQERNASDELQSTNHQKKTMEREIILIEYEIKNLKEQKQWDEAAFNKALDDLKRLLDTEADESQCYWQYNWKTVKWDIWYCPNKPGLSEIRQVNQKARTAKMKLETTVKSLSLKEEEAAKKRGIDNELLIKIERMSHEMHQLSKDVQPIGKLSGSLSQLWENLKKLDNSWNEFGSICGKIQSGAMKSLDIIDEANRTSTHWNNQHSEKIVLILDKMKEDLSLVKTLIDNYLEGSSNLITEIVAEVEQMMTKRENLGESERSDTSENLNLNGKESGTNENPNLSTNSKR